MVLNRPKKTGRRHRIDRQEISLVNMSVEWRVTSDVLKAEGFQGRFNREKSGKGTAAISAGSIHEGKIVNNLLMDVNNFSRIG